MEFDLRTLLLLQVLIYLMIGMLQLIMWRLRSTENAFLYWGSANVLASASALLLSLRGVVSDALSIVVANGLVLLALGLMSAGHRRFSAQSVPWVPILLTPLVVMLLFAWSPALIDSIDARTMVIYAVVFLILALSAVDTWRAQQREWLGMRRVALVMQVLICLMMVLGIAHVASTPQVSDDFLAPNTGRFVALFSTFVALMVWGLALVLMASERLENRLVEMARIDTLTRLLNRAGFRALAERQLQQCVRRGKTASLLLMDLDHFKRINDSHGHEAGDRLLCRFAETAQQILRAEDLLARYGGEEFCVLLSGLPLGAAEAVAQRIRTQFESALVDTGTSRFGTTVSIGVTEFALPDETLDAALARADQALYEAKRLGRNCVAVL